MSSPDLPERSRLVLQDLTDAGIRSDIRVLPDSARTAPEAAAAIGCDVSAIANSLVLVADGSPILVMTSGGHRADLSVVAQAVEAETVTMAPPAVVREATGQAIGGVAPAGHPVRLLTFLDGSLRVHEHVWAAAGHPHTVMRLTFADLETLTRGRVIDVV